MAIKRIPLLLAFHLTLLTTAIIIVGVGVAVTRCECEKICVKN